MKYRDGRSEEYWFEVSAEYEQDLSLVGDPWLVCLVPLAVALGEPLRVHDPVDAALLENITGVMQIWHSWYPKLSPVRIEAPVTSSEEEPLRRTAAYFSGGIDSFFTVLRSENPSRVGTSIDDLLYVNGFYLFVQEGEARSRLRNRLAVAAKSLNKAFVDVETNLRATRWSAAPWARLSFGCGLVAAGLCLAKRYRRLIVASTNDFGHLEPWGSHPLTDPLLSTTSTEVIHDGARFSRLEKIAFIAQSDVVQRSLYVCSQLSGDANCGRCWKCLPTMLALELYGALERYETFAEPTLRGVHVNRIFAYESADRVFMADVRDLARNLGRGELGHLLERSLRRSRRLRPVVSVARSVERVPQLRGWGQLVESLVLRTPFL